MAKKLEKEFELVNRIIERHWNRVVVAATWYDSPAAA